MKKITEKRDCYVTKDVEMFQTSDGNKFESESEAIKHEEFITQRKQLKDKYKMKIIDVDDYGLYYSDSLISSELLFVESLDDETKKDLIELYPYLGYDKNKLNKIKVGWNFLIETEYDSNSYGRWSGYTLYIYSLEDVIKEKEEQLKKLNEIK